MTFDQFIAILGGWTVIFSAIIYFLSGRIADKLSIKWNESASKNIAKLQAELAKNNNSLNNLVTLSASNYHQAQDRRIKAIEVLWTNLLAYREVIPSQGQMIYNVFTEEEIENYWTSENPFVIAGRRELLKIDQNEWLKRFHNIEATIEKERPFIGEQIWAKYRLYKVFKGRIAMLILMGIPKKQFHHWQKDSHLKEILESGLTKEEVQEIYAVRITSLNITSAFLENKLLGEINMTLSGEALSDTAFERIKKFEKLVVSPEMDKV